MKIKQLIPETKIECASLPCRQCAYHVPGALCRHTIILEHLEDNKNVN